MAIVSDDPHFRQFAGSLERAIATFDEPDDQDFLARQKRQVDTLISLEKEFKKTLVEHAWGRGVYKSFVEFICNERRNILDARPYFRERQRVFTEKISTALRRRKEQELYRFRFNFRFVQFVLQARKWRPGSAIVRLGKEITAIRNELITMNMPLAISRARIFYSRTPKAHLTYMDLIQIASEGLMSGIDKFVPPFSKVFRSVAIGRMVGNFIEQYSETLVHFFPRDKRKIYRVNKLIGKTAGSVNFDEVADHVNVDADNGHQTTASEISSLMAAASPVSTELSVTDNEGESTRVLDRFAAPSDCQPDVRVEHADSVAAVREAMGVLTPFEHKLLALRGVNF
jgi:DNA-directed RNA polymerase specialized sigma subunit